MAATLNFTIANNVGRSIKVNLMLNGEPWDVSGYSGARMDCRSPLNNEIAAVTLTTDAGTLALDGTALVISIPRVIALGIPPGSYSYDVIFFSEAEEPRRPIKGTLTVEQGATR